MVDEYAGWSSKRRCGYIFYSYYRAEDRGYRYMTAASNGNNNWLFTTSSSYRCNCPRKYGPYGADNDYDTYTAVCFYYPGHSDPILSKWISSAAYSWLKSNTCPKGWGKGYLVASSGNNYTKSAQGYLTSNITHTEKEPVYGYVTRYRTAYYNYLSSRVAKS